MNLNPLAEDLDRFGYKLNVANGLLIKTANDLHKEQGRAVTALTKAFKHDDTVFGSTIAFVDLTGTVGLKGHNIYYPSNHVFSLQVQDLDNHFSDIEKKFSMWILANCFDTLEIFLKDMFATFLFHNRKDYPELVTKALGSDVKSKALSQKAIRNRYAKQNTKTLRQDLRRRFSYFECGEKNNVRDIDLDFWFSSLEQVRHSIAHGTYNIKPQ